MSDAVSAPRAVGTAVAADVVGACRREPRDRGPGTARRRSSCACSCLLAEGHLIIEDFPGVGKTILAKSLARSLHLSFSRLQFTPDLLPTDVTGVNVFNQKTNEFEFRPGPVFANVLLVDEINRASPKTQSALLEAMQECQVTIDGVTYPLQLPFLVVATQNPIEYEGTYALPEAQLDRFTARLSLGYPPLAEEARMLAEQTTSPPLERLEAVADRDEVLGAIAAARAVYVEETVGRVRRRASPPDAGNGASRAGGEPASRHRVAAHGEGPRSRGRARVRAARGRPRARGARPRAPAHPRSRGSGRGRDGNRRGRRGSPGDPGSRMSGARRRRGWARGQVVGS